MSGFTLTATENASRMYMPEEYVFTGRSRKVPSSENSRIAGSRCLTSAGPRPSMAARRNRRRAVDDLHRLRQIDGGRASREMDRHLVGTVHVVFVYGCLIRGVRAVAEVPQVAVLCALEVVAVRAHTERDVTLGRA